MIFRRPQRLKGPQGFAPFFRTALDFGWKIGRVDLFFALHLILGEKLDSWLVVELENC